MAGIFGGRASAPEPKPAAPMPDEMAPGVLEAKRKARMDIMSRAGRSSTILTRPEDRGGGDTYSGSKLGAGG